jgi:hypothetical protein
MRMVFGFEVTQERLPQRVTEKKFREPQRKKTLEDSVALFFNSVTLCGRRSCITSYPKIKTENHFHISIIKHLP